MANDKSLKIGSTFDSSGIAKVETALKRLRKEGVEVAKAFKSINLGTSHGTGMFAKGIAQASESTRKFKGISEDTSRSLKNIWGKQVDEEQKKLAHYTTRVETLSRAYQKQQKILQQFREQGGSPEAIRMAEARSARFGGALIGAQTNKESYGDSVKELLKDPSVMGPMMKAMGIAGTVFGAVAGVAGIYQQSKNWGVNNVAAVGGGVGNVLSGLMGNPAAMGGALTGTYKLPNGDVVSAGDIIKKSQGVGGIYTRDIATMLGGAGAGAAAAFAGSSPLLALPGLGWLGAGGLTALGGIAGGAAGAGMLAKDFFSGGARAQESAKISEAMSSLQGMNPLENLISGNLQATAGMRLSSARRLGGQHMAIAGIGATVGSDLGESLGLGVGLADRFGARNVIGAQGYAAQALRGQQQGLGSEFTGNFLGSLGSAGSNGTEVLAKILSQAVRQGMGSLDVQFFEKLGSSVARASITAGGAVGAAGSQSLAATLMGGITNGGTAAGMHALDIRESGLQGLDKLSRIPAVHFTKMAIAKRLLGDDASGAQILALANASPQELIQGGRRMDALGITESQRLDVLQGGLETATMGLTGNGKSKEALKLQAIIKSSGGFRNALKNPEFRELAGTLVSVATGVSEEEGLGAFEDIAHSRDKLKGGKSLGRISGGLAESQKITTAVQSLQLIGQESEKTARGLDLARDAFSEFVKMFHDVDIQSMTETADKLRELIGIMERKHPGKKPIESQSKAGSTTHSGVPSTTETFSNVLGKLPF